MWLAAGGLVGEEKGLLLAAFGEGGIKEGIVCCCRE